MALLQYSLDVRADVPVAGFPLKAVLSPQVSVPIRFD